MEADVVEESEHGLGLIAEGVAHEGDGASGGFAGEGAVDSLVAEVDLAGHLRDDGDAVVEGDEFLHGGELAGAFDGDGLNGLPAAEGGDVFGEAVGFVEHDEGVVGDGLDGEGFDFGKGMSRGSDEEEFLFEEGFDFEVFGGDGQGDDGEVDLAMGAAFDEGFGGVFLDDDGDVRVLFGEAAKEVG